MHRFIALFCLAAVLAGCAGGAVSTKGPRYPNPVTPGAKACFDNAERQYLAHSFREADLSFANCISAFPYNEITDRSRFLRGEIAFSKGRYADAVPLYRAAYSQIASPEVMPKARFKAGLALYYQKRYDEARRELQPIDRRSVSAILRLRIDSLGVLASRAAGISPNAYITWVLGVLDDYADGAGFYASGVPASELVSEDEAVSSVRRWVEDQSVTLAEIEGLPVDEMHGKRSGGYVSYKHAYTLHRTGDTEGAARKLRGFVSGYPKHEYYSSARLLMMEVGGEVGEGAGVSVGVMLPLSGRYAIYGESVLHGIECAIGVFQPCTGPSGMRLVIRDSEQPYGGARAVDELEREGVVAIIGPLMSKTAVEAANRAQQLGVPLISISQMEGIAEIGDYVFRNNVSASSEIDTLVDYISRQGRFKSFFVLYPDNRKGAEYRRLFATAIEQHGGKVVGSYTYAPNQMEFASELRGRGMVENVAGIAGGGKSYDAIFIPDSFRAVGYIIPTLALMGIRKTQLFGISRWDDPGLVERGGEFVEGAIFVDSFFKKSTDSWVASFVSRFTEAYGVEPTLLEALGFDAMRMIIAAVQQKGARARDTLKDALVATANFPGVAGRITFDEHGDAVRQLNVLTVEDGVIRQIE